jgi:hypothetical protein
VFFFALAAIADFVLPYHPSFPYADTLLPSFGLPRWVYSFANFDGVHYLTIAQSGYRSVDFIQAFFPVYPLVILHSISLFFGQQVNLLILGLGVAYLSSIFLRLVWYFLIREQFGRRIAWYSFFVMLVFPTSFFFNTLYTTSLFFLLVLTTFYLASKKKWILASICILIASATRIEGIFLIPALLTELWIQWVGTRSFSFSLLKLFIRERVFTILWICLGSIGLVLFMAYLAYYFHDPLYFLHVQSSFGAGRSQSLIPYPQVVWRYLKILATTSFFTIQSFTQIQEFISGTVGLLLILLASRKVRISYTVFALFVFFLPTLTGTFSSLPRYILMCFPIYIYLGILASKYPKIATIAFFISFLLLCINTILFVQGYWVA